MHLNSGALAIGWLHVGFLALDVTSQGKPVTSLRGSGGRIHYTIAIIRETTA